MTLRPGRCIVTKLVMKNRPSSIRRATPGAADWKLGEAKAKFSEVVRLAAAGRPQRVTVRGREAVVVVSAREFDHLRSRNTAGSLHELLSRSPLNRLEFGGGSVPSPVREVDL